MRKKRRTTTIDTNKDDDDNDNVFSTVTIEVLQQYKQNNDDMACWAPHFCLVDESITFTNISTTRDGGSALLVYRIV